MKNIVLIILFILMCIPFYSCTEKKEAEQIIAQPAVESVNLQFDLQFTESANGVILYGNTNFPDGTKLGANIVRKGENLVGQDFNIYVNNGKFSSGQFSDRGAPFLGEYRIEIFTPFNKIWQKENILKKIKKYSSTLIQDNGFKIIREATFGDNLSKHTVEEINQRETDYITQLYKASQTALDLLHQGRKMNTLRNSDEMRNCMKRMRVLQPEVKELQNQIDTFPKSGKNIQLGAASTVLDLCVSCSIASAMKSCDEAEWYLKEAKIMR